MVMMLMKSIACVFLVFLSAAMLSTARLMRTGAEVNGSSAMKASIATSTTNKTMVKTLTGIEENLKKLSIKQVKIKVGNANKSASKVQGNRSVRSSYLYDEVDKGLMAFTADYHRPKHHPPKNN
ncbi:hypothetical protein Lal_00020940 [Lupinus albus]|uniref:Uncharacterized protein n=1 Tax=Lupinus albus TaxID=3870 RepID=A0A6A4QN57_LUPAL|nr:hypothetical protein Lalb_Chr04g0255371 [Lupinus albus]KAF1869263.1 hypothetical protein Lal_00020940 [Lupinus albus]